jgi:hypothetical protein
MLLQSHDKVQNGQGRTPQDGAPMKRTLEGMVHVHAGRRRADDTTQDWTRQKWTACTCRIVGAEGMPRERARVPKTSMYTTQELQLIVTIARRRRRRPKELGAPKGPRARRRANRRHPRAVRSLPLLGHLGLEDLPRYTL